MARIRSIKPELPQDVRLAKLSRVVRLHFIYLLTVADDEGYFRAAPRLLLGQLYPHDRDVMEGEVDRMTAELVGAGFIELFQGDDGPVGRFRNWKRHQKVDNPSKSHLRGVVEGISVRDSRESREGVAHGVLSLESRSLDLSSSGSEVDAPTPERPADPERAYVYAVVLVANKALSELLAGAHKPIVAEVELDGGPAVRWFRAGIPLDIPNTLIPDRIASYRTSKYNRQPMSLKYFDAAVLEAWERERSVPAYAGGEVEADRVLAYANMRWNTDWAQTAGRVRLIRLRLLGLGELGALLFAVDGINTNPWYRQHGKLDPESCFKDDETAEKFAVTGGWKRGKPHPYESAELAA